MTTIIVKLHDGRQFIVLDNTTLNLSTKKERAISNVKVEQNITLEEIDYYYIINI